MHARVLETTRLTPHLIRVVLGEGDLDRFAMVEATDAYVNLAFPPADAPYAAVFDTATVRAEHDQHVQPARRRYTVRAWDPDLRRLTIDFVVHGDSGVAGPWAERAVPGDVLVLDGPSGGYRPDAGADWHLMVGDESALPAIAASLEVLPAGALAVVRLVCDGPDDELDLTTPGRLDLAWTHRPAEGHDADQLAAVVAGIDFPRGRVHAFVHGEATEIRAIRRHLLAERGLARAEMSCSPYWRRDLTDEAWRRVKRDFVAAMDADVAV